MMVTLRSGVGVGGEGGRGVAVRVGGAGTVAVVAGAGAVTGLAPPEAPPQAVSNTATTAASDEVTRMPPL
ncbi:hypothetical protein GCM10025789_06710 [Tessaracoccus lubricantis]|uniref:Uncharacterized protein n=1 Tax=Tessaracoccus lubricantis TaxID=545543 RepID=A0ABP9F5B3_9ACTN